MESALIQNRISDGIRKTTYPDAEDRARPQNTSVEFIIWSELVLSFRVLLFRLPRGSVPVRRTNQYEQTEPNVLLHCR